MRHRMAIAQRWVDMRSQTGPTSRKQREVYVGNLAVGIVTEAMLAEVFDSALESLSPDDAGPPSSASRSHPTAPTPSPRCEPRNSATRRCI